MKKNIHAASLQSLTLFRQAFVVASLLIMAGLGLYVMGYTLGLLLPLLVSGGLLFSGVTGWCPMAFFLSFAPWNNVTVE